MFAIERRRLVQLRYDGKVRVVEPHDYGVQNGVVKLLVYQLKATLSHQSATGWRLLHVRRIEDLEVLDAEFPGSRGADYRDHNAWDELYARVR